MAALLIVTGCSQGADATNQGNSAAAAAPEASNSAQAASPARPAAATCPPPPELRLVEGFEDPRRVFTDGSDALRTTRSNFETAYARACTAGIVDAMGLGATEGGGGVLHLRNAPHANQPGIFMDEEQEPRRLILEAPLISEAGQATVPPVEALEEAIFCHLRGATPAQQEENGRCLPD